MKTGIRHISIIWLVALFVFPNFCVAKKADSLFPNDYTTSYYDSLGVYYSSRSDNQKAISFQILASELKADVLNPYFKKVKQLMPKAGDSLILTRLYYRFGQFLSGKGKQKQATAYFQEALRLARTMHDDKAIATLANELAGEYRSLGKIRLSTLRYKESLAAAIRFNDSNLMAAAHLNLGDIYKEKGNLEAGMNELIKALKIKEAIDDSSQLSFYYIKAGEMAKASRHWKKWEEYIQKAYEIKDLDHCATPMEKAIIYENLGSIARQNHQLEKAFRYFDTTMDISRKINYINGIKVALNNHAQLYRLLGQPAKALRLLLVADKYPTENPFYRISSNNTKAELYLETREYKKALRLLNKNVSNPASGNYANEKLKTLQLLYKVNIEQKNYKEAFRWNDSLRDFENFLRDKHVRTKIAWLETKYQSGKNKRVIEMLKAKNETYDQQIRFAILFIVGLIVAIIFGIFTARMSKLKAEYRENQLQQQVLRSQMNPHFIFNALASIQQMIQNQETKAAAFYLGKFASIARLILEYSREESIPLEKELEVLQSYIELEKLRSGNHFEYIINFAHELETEFIRIPPAAIQPFVENAIKHGLKEKQEGGLLQLSFEDQGEVLEVVIEDNGIGIEQAQNKTGKQHKSMAMAIFEERRRLMQKRYKKKLSVRFLDLNREGKTGTRVIIHLPVL